MRNFEYWVETDLSHGPQPHMIGSCIFQNDVNASLLGVVVYDHGVPHQLDGSIKAYALRADGNTVVMDGYMDGNKAWVILPQSAYTVPGKLTVVLKNVTDSEKATLAAFQTIIQKTESDTFVGDETILTPDQIEEIVSSIEAELAKLENLSVSVEMLEPDQSPSATLENGTIHFQIPKAIGEKGDKGDPGFTPTVSLAQDENKVIVTANNQNGSQSVDIPFGVTADKLLSAFPHAEISARLAHFEDGGDGYPLRSAMIAFSPIQTGTGTPSMANPRPIYGTKKLNVMRFGKNLFHYAFEDGQEDLAPISDLNELKTDLASGQMLFRGMNIGSDLVLTVGLDSLTNQVWAFVPACSGYTYTINKYSKESAIYLLDEDLSVLSSMTGSGSGMAASRVFTVPNNELVCWAAFYVHDYSQTGSQNPWTILDVIDGLQVEYGSGTTDYEACQIINTERDFPESQSPIYGGTLDLISGKLVIDQIKVAVKDLQRTQRYQSGNYAVYQGWALPFPAPAVTNTAKRGAISNLLTENNAYNGVAHINERSAATSFAINTSGTILGMHDTDTSLTEDELQEKYADLEVVYPLAEPVTYDLDPIEIKTLLGVNNIFANHGEISLSYTADPTLFVTRKIEALTAIISE